MVSVKRAVLYPDLRRELNDIAQNLFFMRGVLETYSLTVAVCNWLFRGPNACLGQLPLKACLPSCACGASGSSQNTPVKNHCPTAHAGTLAFQKTTLTKN